MRAGPAALLVVLTVLGAAVSPARADVTPAGTALLPTFCPRTVQEEQKFQQDRNAHNAKPHRFRVPEQKAALKAYDAEAAKLEVRRKQVAARLGDCLAVAQDYAAAGGHPLTASPEEVRQGHEPPAVGDPDPAFPGRTFGAKLDGRANVLAEPVVPLPELTRMPNFTRLTAANQRLVTGYPRNVRYLGAEARLIGSSGSAALVRRPDPGWSAAQSTLPATVRPALQKLIDALLRLQ